MADAPETATGSGSRKRAVAMALTVILIGAGAGAYFWFNRTPEVVTACRVYIQASLRSPATYQEATQRTFDRSIAQAQLRSEYFPAPQSELDRLHLAGLDGRSLAIRTVFLEYDAANAYGTPIRGISACEFLLVDGQVRGAGSLESKARSAALAEDTARLAETLGNEELRRLSRRRGTGLPCCVRE